MSAKSVVTVLLLYNLCIGISEDLKSITIREHFDEDHKILGGTLE